MDIQMPVMDGYVTTQRIRQWELDTGVARRVPIVALTADAFEEDRQRCLAVGMNDFLTKPVSFDALSTTLAKWLDHDVGAGEVTATSPGPRQIEAAALGALVDDITPMLEHNKFDALGKFKEIEALAAGTDLAKPFEKVGLLLRDFKFPEALEQLRVTVTPHLKDTLV
jgi:CheY-like chemotaxis protein